jgi:hypothetical protein
LQFLLLILDFSLWIVPLVCAVTARPTTLLVIGRTSPSARGKIGLRRSGAGVNADDLFDSKPSPRTDSIVRRCGSVGGAYHCICPFDHGTPNMTVYDFHQSLTASKPPAGLTLTLALAGLWWDAKRDWTQAHASAQQDEGPEGSWVHA